MSYLEVAVAAPLDHTLTYLPSVAAPLAPLPGQRLLVPLGGRLVTGYLLSVSPGAPEVDAARLKPVADVLDSAPLFPAEIIPFFRWLARYYHYPIGEVIKSALPGGLTVQSGWRAVLTESGKARLAGLPDGGNRARSWQADLLAKGELSPAAVRGIRRTGDGAILQKWQEDGWLEIRRELVGGAVKARTETFVALTEEGRRQAVNPDGDGDLKLSERKTLDLLVQLACVPGSGLPQAVARRHITREYAGAGKALKSLADRQLVDLTVRPVYRDPFGEPHLHYGEPEELTPEQTTVLAQLLPAIRNRQYAPFLVHGVTGSGKTEIYLQAAAAALQAGRSVLVLVPEIALATQLEGHFLSRFGNGVALLHSGLSPGELYDQWLRILQGAARVVIGARSAVFAPLRNIGLIVVDEEHDSAYKQEEGLRYQGRDAAILRASLGKAAVVLGSATPSATSYYHAITGKYRLLTMKNRIAQRPLPEVRVVDLRSIKTATGRPPLFSGELVSGLRENLKRQQQSLVFLNRRGYASLVVCAVCGQSLQCRNCHISLTLHRGRNELLCHYCGYGVSSAVLCGNCGSGRMVRVGFGTERLEHELAKLFPTARIARLDRDTCASRKDYLSVLKAMQKHQVDILVGTQMIAKGHHFPMVTLVGIVWADAGLGMPDFRAGERTFQLLAQVTGRAGRGEEAGRVIIQTLQPDHYSVALARKHDYEGLYRKEIDLRKELGFPPFSRLINLRIEGDTDETVRDFALGLARIAKQRNTFRRPVAILGPAAAPLGRLRRKFRWQLLLKGTGLESLHRLCVRLLQQAAMLPGATKVKVTVDVDPENML